MTTPTRTQLNGLLTDAIIYQDLRLQAACRHLLGPLWVTCRGRTPEQAAAVQAEAERVVRAALAAG